MNQTSWGIRLEKETGAIWGYAQLKLVLPAGSSLYKPLTPCFGVVIGTVFVLKGWRFLQDVSLAPDAAGSKRLPRPPILPAPWGMKRFAPVDLFIVRPVCVSGLTG